MQVEDEEEEEEMCTDPVCLSGISSDSEVSGGGGRLLFLSEYLVNKLTEKHSRVKCDLLPSDQFSATSR